jgi:hypothetical protein
MLTLGGLLSTETSAESTDVQPLTGSVTVSVYVPAALTVGVAVLAPETMFPPLLATQLKVAPAVVDEPDNWSDVTEHVSSLSGPAFTFGATVFAVTTTFTGSLAQPDPVVAVTK